MKLRWLIKADGSRVLQYYCEYDYWSDIEEITEAQDIINSENERKRDAAERKAIEERLNGTAYTVRNWPLKK